MSKGLSQYNNKERREVIARRLNGKAEGLGPLAAKDAEKYLTKEKKKDDNI